MNHSPYFLHKSAREDGVVLHTDGATPQLVISNTFQELLKMSEDEIRKNLGELTPCAKATLHLYFNGYK